MRSHRTLSCLSVILTMVLTLAFPALLRADAFTDYQLTNAFQLPASGPFDVLADGRVLSLDGATVYLETTVGSGQFDAIGSLPSADMPNPIYATPAFLRLSPDCSHIAVGNNGGSTWTNFEVGIFDLATLSGDWYDVTHYDAAWIDNQHLALTAGSSSGTSGLVTALDTQSPISSPINPTLIDNIGGYSGGITFDADGNLYTGNGYATGGPSDTGYVGAFSASSWMPALSGGAAVDFETSGQWVCDLLSAGSLGFDAEGNLHVGGGDVYGSGDADYAGLVHHDAVAAALAGFGPADATDPTVVRKLDPDSVFANTYDVVYNDATSELLLRDGGTVYTYAVPEPASGMLLLILGAAFVRRGSHRKS